LQLLRNGTKKFMRREIDLYQGQAGDRSKCTMKGTSAGQEGDWFAISDPRAKVRALSQTLGEVLQSTEPRGTFSLGRNVGVVGPAELPDKPGLASQAGQARLLHDLANIELQALELAVRTLSEFPDAPADFRMQLAEIAEGEGRHLELCLDGLEKLGYQWGSWNVHLCLWNTVSSEDSLLDRILIVHRYLEGSGLDAGESILKRLMGVGACGAKEAVEVIVREEVDHVLFGSRWYHQIAKELKIDPEADFATRIAQIAQIAPRRERLARDLRKRAGFTDAELDILSRIR
jgi:uncharacterized ferritin-like protein (DUF455 family)